MPLREDLLNPIPGDNPSGQDLRYQPIYDKIKEARREEDDLAQGAWQRERKLADHPLVIKLTQEAIATKSKDLQLAAWMLEALLKKDGFRGLREGLGAIRGLLETFWETLYPVIEDGDLELRAAPLEWIGGKFEQPLKMVPIVAAGHGFYRFKESRTVQAEEQAKTPDQKKAREKQLKEGKLAPEDFDKSFNETPKFFYAQSEKDLDGSIELVSAIDEYCAEKFGDAAPSLSKLKSSLEEVRHQIHVFLEEKRKKEPDPVEEVAAPPPEAGPDAAEAGDGAASAMAAAPGAFVIPALGSSEPADRREAIANVAAAAAMLRRREPLSPAPYLMMRGLRWGELRASAELSDPTMLEAPPTEIRQHVKRLALDKKWKELLEASENVMALPCSRAWLDLQRFVVDACVALGPEYNAIAIAIRSELRTLLRDLPQLLQTNLMDDTPAANADTQAWLKELMAEPGDAPPKPKLPNSVALDDPQTAGWQKKFIDSYALAMEAQRSGQEGRAFEILHKEIERQRSGRGRFQRKLQLVQLCVSTGKEAIAQPLLDDLAATIETHKLDDWEDREMVAAALATIMKASKKIQGDAKEKQKMFERICRLDPVQALGC